jgi:hypothetical protein
MSGTGNSQKLTVPLNHARHEADWVTVSHLNRYRAEAFCGAV